MNTPSWLIRNNIKTTVDARPLLAQGIHPLEQVQKECAALQSGEIFEIITSFLPAPMIEKMAAEGFDTYTEAGDNGMFHTCFHKP
jgi:uncharacterized protein (DUF2249 family)